MDPEHVDTLKTMKTPLFASKLSQLLHCCRWMSKTIPGCAPHFSPRNDLRDYSYKISEKRKRSSIKNIRLCYLVSSSKNTEVFKSIQKTLFDAIQFSIPKRDHSICIHTDVTKVLRQSGNTSTSRPAQGFQEWKVHKPIAFIGSELLNCQRNWSTFEEEVYKIFRLFGKMDYILLEEQLVHIFTYHRNVFCFAPLALEPTVTSFPK